jgi:hypothetical protein
MESITVTAIVTGKDGTWSLTETIDAKETSKLTESTTIYACEDGLTLVFQNLLTLL